MFFRLRKAQNFSMGELLRSNCVTTSIIRDGAGLRNHFPAEKGDGTARRRPSCPVGIHLCFFRGRGVPWERSSLSKKVLTSWWTGKQAPPPGAASQIFDLSRRQFRQRRNLKTQRVFSLPATLYQFLLKSIRFPGAKTARKRFLLWKMGFSGAKIVPCPPYMPLGTIESSRGLVALSSSPGVFRQSEAFHGNVQNFRDGLKFQIGDDAGTMLCPGQRAPADRNRPGFRFDGQLFLPAACLFPGPANAFPGDVQKGR